MCVLCVLEWIFFAKETNISSAKFNNRETTLNRLYMKTDTKILIYVTCRDSVRSKVLSHQGGGLFSSYLFSNVLFMC